MKRDYPDRPLIGVGAVIVADNRVVVVRRGHEPLRGEWSIPGGVLEIGETLRAGAEREALEETGLVVKAGEVLGVFDRVVPGDAADARWVTLDDLQTIDIAEPAAGLIRRALGAE